MALSAAAGSLNTSTAAAGNTVAVAGLGFQPKIVFFWWSGRVDTTDAAGRGDHKRGFGAAISTTDRRRANSLAQDTPTAMLTNRSQDDTECIGISTTADATDGLMDLQSMDAGGFTLVIDDAFTLDYRIHYLALGGADLTNVVGGTLVKATTTGDQDVTSLAFQPDLVVFFSAMIAGMAGGVNQDSSWMMGAACSSSQQAVYAGGSNDGSANAQTISYCNDAECLALLPAAVTSVTDRATFVSMLSNGFRINWAENAGGSEQICFVALKGAGFKVGSVTTQTDTSTTMTTGSLGFTPRGGLLFSHCKAESTTDTVQDDDEWSCGGFSSTSARAACAMADDDAAGTAVVSTAVEHDEVYVNLAAATGAVEGLMDVSAMGSDDVTFIMDDADPSGAHVNYIIFGDTPVVATGGGEMTLWGGTWGPPVNG